MNILLNTDSLAFYIGQDFTLTDEGVILSNGMINTDNNSSNCSVVDTNPPSPAIDFAWKWNGSSWEVYDQEAIDAYYAGIAAQEAQANKQKAIALLAATDWTTIGDIGNPNLSNPYLANQGEFITYRNQVRQYAVYPTPGTIDWPTLPQENWQRVQVSK